MVFTVLRKPKNGLNQNNKKSRLRPLYQTATRAMEANQEQPQDELEDQEEQPQDELEDQQEQPQDELEDQQEQPQDELEDQQDVTSEALADPNNICMPTYVTASCWGSVSISAKEKSLIDLGWDGFFCTLRGGNLELDASHIMLRNVVRYLIRVSQVSFHIDHFPCIPDGTTLQHLT